MPKYIDADKAYGLIYRCYCEHCDDTLCGSCNISHILDCIEDEPDADVEEVRHGKWVLGELDGEWRCSKCGAYTDGNIKPTWKYCRHCGAKMYG